MYLYVKIHKYCLTNYFLILNKEMFNPYIQICQKMHIIGTCMICTRELDN